MAKTEIVPSPARILTLDLENSPNVAHVWSLWGDHSIGLNQLMESTKTIAFAAKWLDDEEIFFYSDHHDGHKDMVLAAWALLNTADIVISYNGIQFDMPHLNREFAMAGYDPPSPYKQVDLYRVVKKNFRFPSNKLQYVSTALGLEGKQQHEGHTLWVKCMAGDPEAWDSMKEYNIQDVVVTEKLYLKLRPWVSNHPNMGVFVDEARPLCEKCGSPKMQKRGVARVGLSAYQRFQCQGCGGWSRSGKAVNRVDIRGVAG